MNMHVNQISVMMVVVIQPPHTLGNIGFVTTVLKEWKTAQAIVL